jgi:hypothetical protein
MFLTKCTTANTFTHSLIIFAYATNDVKIMPQKAGHEECTPTWYASPVYWYLSVQGKLNSWSLVYFRRQFRMYNVVLFYQTN